MQLEQWEQDAAEDSALRWEVAAPNVDPCELIIVREAARVRLARARLALQGRRAGEDARDEAMVLMMSAVGS